MLAPPIPATRTPRSPYSGSGSACSVTVTSAGTAVRDGAWPPREKGVCLQANSNALPSKFLFRLRLLGKEQQGRGVVRSEAQPAARSVRLWLGHPQGSLGGRVGAAAAPARGLLCWRPAASPQESQRNILPRACVLLRLLRKGPDFATHFRLLI